MVPTACSTAFLKASAIAPSLAITSLPPLIVENPCASTILVSCSAGPANEIGKHYGEDKKIKGWASGKSVNRGFPGLCSNAIKPFSGPAGLLIWAKDVFYWKKGASACHITQSRLIQSSITYFKIFASRGEMVPFTLFRWGRSRRLRQRRSRTL